MDIIDKDYCGSCPPCTPIPFAAEKTPCFVKVVFSGIVICPFLPPIPPAPNRGFLCELAGACRWGYGGYDYQVEFWPQPAGTTCSAYDDTLATQYFKDVVWGECALNFTNEQDCWFDDPAAEGNAVVIPGHGPPMEFAYTFGLAPVVGIRFARTQHANDIDIYRLQNYKNNINVLIQYDTKY